jgi:8-oxo-dGTP diphosphatase
MGQVSRLPEYEWRVADVDLRISVDPVLFTFESNRLRVLLRRRSWDPFIGMWALPGVINAAGEQIEKTLQAELDRIGIPPEVWVEQLKTFDRPPQTIGNLTRPGRDPRGRVISVASFGIVSPQARAETVRSQNADITWAPVSDLPDLAFDHREIIDYAFWRLRNKIQYAPVAFELLAKEFTLTQVQEVHESVLGVKLDKRNFRRKILTDNAVVPTGSVSRRERRPAKLYRYAGQREPRDADSDGSRVLGVTAQGAASA